MKWPLSVAVPDTATYTPSSIHTISLSWEVEFPESGWVVGPREVSIMIDLALFHS